MSHSRTSSFFKQPAAIQHQWVQSPDGPSNIGQQQHLAPLSNTLAAPRQGHPLLQNIPTDPPWQAQTPPQQQFPPQQHNNQQSIPPLSQSQQQQLQTPPQPRPQPQPQQSNVNRTSITSQQRAPVTRSPLINGVSQAPASPPLHPEIRSVVQLMIAHDHKTYFSGPLLRRIEKHPNGQKPHKDEGWTEVFAQLDGTTLHFWDKKEASKQGREVPPPSSINVTDAFIQVLGSVTVPATPSVPSKRYTNIIMLNTMGLNLLLFSCPSTAALVSWAAALRLAAWEKSKLEEIYTAHLIRITLSAPNVPTTLVRGKMEGWAKIRIAGQTAFKRVWLVVQGGLGIEGDGAGTAGAGVHTKMKRNRVSSLFSRETDASNPLPTKSSISMFTSPKSKDRKKPLLTVHGVTQAFGVYPKQVEEINRSTLMKVEGTFGDDEMAATFRMREGWVLIMPEVENNLRQAAEMLKWVVGLHDAFELYGRPKAWTWDPRDPVSLMFGYPTGPQKENLFLDRDIVEGMDLSDQSTSVMRSTMTHFLQTHMKPPVQVVQPRQSPSPGPQLPPPSVGNSARAVPSRNRPLTPTTERNSVMTHGRTVSMGGPSILSPNHASHQSATSPSDQQPENSPSGQFGVGSAILGPSNPNASSFMPTSAAAGSTSTSTPILDRPILYTPPTTSPNTLLAQPQNGLAMDASPQMTTTHNAWHGTQSINNMNQAISTTSFAPSASPESPKVQDSPSNLPASGRLSASPPAAASVQAGPIPTSLRPGFARNVLPSDHMAYDDPTGEAYAAFSYLDPTDAQDLEMELSTITLGPKIESLHVQHAESASGSSPQQPGPTVGDAVPYISTLASTNKTGERDHEAQAQQAAGHPATLRPGRANEKLRIKNAGAWKGSEGQDAEEGEEEKHLPQISPERGQTGDFHQAQPMPRRQATEQYANPYRRSHYEDDPDRSPGRAPQPDQRPNNSRDAFVQLEPSETTTKAFTPQGLPSAGLQDKEHRSAPRQEEVACKSCASLIKISNKPPPVLLGAITAHEREGKHEGDHQRQQLDRMQQRGSISGGQFGFNPMTMGMNPMMAMNPMMMGGGMSPVMTSGGMAPFDSMMTSPMGYPGMMSGFNPPHMFAAQQAAQVYHQTLMAFSAAVSQVGGGGGNGAPSQMNSGMGGMNAGMSNTGLGSGMNPAMGGGMGGYDPRMSMMGMPMMGMGMGMSVAPPQMNNQMPVGIEMTGMSTFDPNASPGGANNAPAGKIILSPSNQNA